MDPFNIHMQYTEFLGQRYSDKLSHLIINTDAFTTPRCLIIYPAVRFLPPFPLIALTT